MSERMSEARQSSGRAQRRRGASSNLQSRRVASATSHRRKMVAFQETDDETKKGARRARYQGHVVHP